MKNRIHQTFTGFITWAVFLAAQPGFTQINVSDLSHPVAYKKELVITNPDAVLHSRQSKPGGNWHFNEALKRILGTTDNTTLEQVFFAWSNLWESRQTVGNDQANPRQGVKEFLDEAFIENRIQLIAIVNRIDLSRFKNNDLNEEVVKLGEGRFIYQVISEQKSAEKFTIIFEYGLPPLDEELSLNENLKLWAQLWHTLSDPAISDSEYLTRLDDVVFAFSKTNTLRQIRTNEFLDDNSGLWEMREFHLQDNLLEPRAVAQTPRDSLKDSGQHHILGEYIGNYEPEIIRGAHDMSANPDGRAILGAKSTFLPSGSQHWVAPGASKRGLYIFELNTCNGCHKDNAQLDTPNQHIARFNNTEEAELSKFLLGEIETQVALPGCDTSTLDDNPWCGPNKWNEKLFREYIQEKFSSSNPGEFEKSIRDGQLEFFVSGFRYH